MPVLPRPTSLTTTYLPILSGMRLTGLASGTAFGTEVDIWARRRCEKAHQDTVSPRHATVMQASRSPARAERGGGGAACGAEGPLSGNADNRNARTPSDRKSTRLNSSHTVISYAVFCLKK